MRFNAANFAKIRAAKGMTLGDVADALGVSKPSVWAWEHGKAKPLPDRIPDIAEALGVDADLLRARPDNETVRDVLISAQRAIHDALRLIDAR